MNAAGAKPIALPARITLTDNDPRTAPMLAALTPHPSATRAERSADVTGGDKATLTELRGERKDAASALDDAERALADAFLFTALDLPRPKRGAPARVETGDSAPDAGIVSEDLTAGW